MSLTMTKSTKGYGCQREVYHPCSKLAEPGAVSFYESSDEEDEVGKVGSVTLLSVEIKSSPKAFPKAPLKASTRNTTQDAIVLREEDATESKVRSSPEKTVAILDAGDSSMEDIAPKSEERVVEVERPAGDEDIMMLDETLTASPSKSITVASPSRTTHSPAAQPSTARPKRTPFDVLTPENTFGASSPFKIGSADGARKSLSRASPKDKEYYEVPGGFSDNTLSEISQGTSIIFSDTQGFFASLFLFAATLVLDVVTYSVTQYELEDD